MDSKLKEDRLIKIKDVLRICAISRTSVYVGMKNGKFPAQVKQSKRAVAWSLSEVQQWIADHKKLRE